MNEESPGRITITDQQQGNIDHEVKQIELRLKELAHSELGREATLGQSVTPGKESIYTEQISQLINTSDEILLHVEVIESKVGVLLQPSPPQEAHSGLPDVPAESPTILSNRLAELASHLGRLSEEVLRLENRIVS